MIILDQESLIMTLEKTSKEMLAKDFLFDQVRLYLISFEEHIGGVVGGNSSLPRVVELPPR